MYHPEPVYANMPEVRGITPSTGHKTGISPYSEWQNSIGWETIADPGPGLPDFQQLSRFHNNNNFINELACGASFSKNRVAGVKQHAG